MTTVLITGANRGLGLDLVQKLATNDDAPSLIITTCRDASKADCLQALANEYDAIKILELDVTDTSSFASFSEIVSDLVGENGLNVLINNAGIHTHRDTFEDVTEDDYVDTFRTNLLGPVFLTKTLLPLVQLAADKNIDLPMCMKRAAIVQISSALGSVELNTNGEHYAYREAKAGLNTFTRNLGVEFKDSGIIIVPLHPGWVQTDLGGLEAPLTIDESTSGIIKVLYGLDESSHGQFLQWDGGKLPW